MIPKIIHYCWFGGNPMPDIVKNCIKSWERVCPGYKIIRWDESNYDIKKNLYMREAYEKKRWGFVPDYARLDIIYNYGGIYLDTDVEVLKPFDALLDNDAFLGFESGCSIAPGLIIAASPKHPAIKEMLDEIYGNRSFIRLDGTEDLTPNPELTTDFFINRGLVKKDCLQELKGVTIYPTEYFCPKNYKTGECRVTKNTYAIHYYQESWKTRKEKRWSEFERKIIREIGENKFKVLLSSRIYILIRVLYTKGVCYVLRRVMKFK